MARWRDLEYLVTLTATAAAMALIGGVIVAPLVP
jgi:hypothetical protein